MVTPKVDMDHACFHLANFVKQQFHYIAVDIYLLIKISSQGLEKCKQLLGCSYIRSGYPI